jgi:hypothetical protein
VTGRRFGRNGHSGIEAVNAGFFLTIGVHLDHAHFYDAVFGEIDAGGFKVKHKQGSVQLKIHIQVIGCVIGCFTKIPQSGGWFR